VPLGSLEEKTFSSALLSIFLTSVELHSFQMIFPKRQGKKWEEKSKDKNLQKYKEIEAQ